MTSTPGGAEPPTPEGPDSAGRGGAASSVDLATRWARPPDWPDPNGEHVDAALAADSDEDDPDAPGSDWAWVEEWRQSGERPAWAHGVTLAAFAVLVVGTAVFVLSVGLGDMPWLAIAANVVVAAGLAPALWLCRSLPVLRFLAGGAALGVAIGWIAALLN
jgi:hypothetical protein